MLIVKNHLLVFLLLLLSIIMRSTSSTSLFDKLPKNADIFVSSDSLKFLNTFLKTSNNSDDLGESGPTIGIMQQSPTVLEKVKQSSQYGSSNFLVLFLCFSNNSDTLTVLHEISRYYSDESKLKRALTIFILTYSTEEVELVQLESSLPWEIALFLVQLNDSNKIMNVLELVTLNKCPYYTTRQFSLQQIAPDFFATLLSRRNKQNLNGSVVRALAVDNLDERYSAEFDKNGSSLAFFDGGYTVSLLKDLRDTLNFSLEAVSGKEYISDGNNTLGGLGAQLLDYEADLIISMSYALEFRLKFLTPTVAFNRDKVRVFFRQPSQFLHRNIFLHPFHDFVWISLLVTLGLIALSAKLQFHWGYCQWNKDTKKKYFWILGALCQKSCSCLPDKIPGRILLLVTFLTSWLLFTFYSASIISRLSVSRNPITSLMGLISAQYKLLADPLVSYSKFLQLTSSSQDWEKTFVSEVDAVSKVYAGGHGFITSIDLVVIASRNLGHSEQTICDTISSVSFFDIEMPLHFYTRKGYQYKDLINRKLLNAIERGFNHRYRKEFLWHTNPVCTVTTQATFDSVGLSEVYSVFIGIAFIYVVTFIMLIMEMRFFKFPNEQKNISNISKESSKETAKIVPKLHKKENNVMWVVRTIKHFRLK